MDEIGTAVEWCRGVRFRTVEFRGRNPIPPMMGRVFGASARSTKRPPANVVGKYGERRWLRLLLRHLTTIQNYEVRPKIALMCF
ncbi:hypothetical protein AVEN_112930-1 [Araneus ventricosus]|uniref:Uncharacterized protein n=1 Tax=Araneus ventricosus TaxID=182803 RepID=A0A4Y2V4E8_ARAVE|nr:hypothetical protein AVEN_112930-1 [Araneus ventricosus]